MAHLQDAAVKQIHAICDRYAQEKTPLMMILSDIQKEYGYIPLEVQELVSARTGVPVSEIQSNREKYAKEFAAQYGVTILLKGHHTIITNGEEVFVNPTGSSALAKGGSGDVLSGILSGICASNDASLIENVAIGAYINGYAGELARDELCDISMSAYDTAKNVGAAISKLIR